MRISVVVLWLSAVLPGLVKAQDAPQTPTPPGTQPASTAVSAPQSDASGEIETDRFPALREAADSAKGRYEEMDAKNNAEIDRLMRTKRCQTNRIEPLLAQMIAAMQEWETAEKRYWHDWGDAEQRRVDSQKESLAVMEAGLKDLADQQEKEQADQQELLRRKASLEQGRRTEQITAQIDDLIKQIQDSEAKLAQAKQQFEDLTKQINNMKTSIDARLINIRQNFRTVEALGTYQISVYEKARTAAHEVCNTKKPDERSSPLPKKTSKTTKPSGAQSDAEKSPN